MDLVVITEINNFATRIMTINNTIYYASIKITFV